MSRPTELATVELDTLLQSRRCLVSFLNPFSYLMLSRHPALLKEVDLWGYDGSALRSLSNRLFQTKFPRLSFDFTSLADPVFSHCQALGKTVAIIGSDAQSNQAFIRILAQRYPALNIAWARDGYFTGEQYPDAVQQIAAQQPDVLVCGMGAVLQEQFLVDCRAAGWEGVGFTCGGFIHQTASHQGNYYPQWVDKLNVRFLYRMWDEPQLIRRYLFEYPQGLWRFYRNNRC